MEDPKRQGTRPTFFIAYQERGNAEAQQIKTWCIQCLQVTYPSSVIYIGEVTGNKHLFINGRVKSYAQARRQIRGPLVFLDTDIVALCPIPNIWSETFDVGLTKGNLPLEYNLQPYNGGMIFSQDTPGAQYFCDYIEQVCLNTMEGVYMDKWFVDQLAMGKAWDTQQDKIKFKVFEKEYNYFPTEENDHGPAYFMHFKGDRKNFMKLHVDQVLNATA